MGTAGGTGTNVGVGGFLSNFTSEGSSTEFLIEDPTLLGLPANLGLPSGSAVQSQFNAYGGTFTGGVATNAYDFVGTTSDNTFGQVSVTDPSTTSVNGLDFSNVQFTGGGPRGSA